MPVNARAWDESAQVTNPKTTSTLRLNGILKITMPITNTLRT